MPAESLRTSTTEGALYCTLRGLPLRRDVVLYEAAAATLDGQESPTPLQLATFATQSCRRQAHLWSERVRRQYRWALLRLLL